MKFVEGRQTLCRKDHQYTTLKLMEKLNTLTEFQNHLEANLGEKD